MDCRPESLAGDLLGRDRETMQTGVEANGEEGELGGRARRSGDRGRSGTAPELPLGRDRDEIGSGTGQLPNSRLASPVAQAPAGRFCRDLRPFAVQSHPATQLVFNNFITLDTLKS